MKITLLLILTLSFAFGKYPYGNIDMHGGKKDPLTSGSTGFSQMKSNSSSLFLNEKKKHENINKDKRKKEKKDKLK